MFKGVEAQPLVPEDAEDRAFGFFLTLVLELGGIGSLPLLILLPNSAVVLFLLPLPRPLLAVAILLHFAC